MGVAACLLLEYGVSTAAVAVGWSQYLNKLLDNVVGFHLPQAISAGPWDSEPGVINLPAIVLVAMCAVLLIRGASQSAKANAVMVVIKLAVLVIFAAIAFTAFKADRFHDLAPFGVSGISLAAGTIFFAYIGLDAISTAGDEVKDPQHTMPRAIIYALLIVTAIHLLVVVAAMGSQPWQEFKGEEAVLAVILDHITGNTAGSTLVSAGAVISIFSVTLVTLYGQTRILFAMGRDGLLPATFAKVNPRTMTPVGNTVIVAVVVAALAALVPLDRLAETVSIGTLTAFIVVSGGVIRPAHSTTGVAPRFQGAGLSGDTNPVDRGVRLHPVQPALVHLDRIQRLGGGGAGLLPGVGSPSQCAQRRREQRHRNGRTRHRRCHEVQPSHLNLRATELLLFHLVAAALVAARRVHRRFTFVRHGNRLRPMVIVPGGEPAGRGAGNEDGPDDEDRARDDPDPFQGAAQPTRLCHFRCRVDAGFRCFTHCSLRRSSRVAGPFPLVSLLVELRQTSCVDVSLLQS